MHARNLRLGIVLLGLGFVTAAAAASPARLLWSDARDEAGVPDQGFAVDANQRGAFLAGLVRNRDGYSDLLVRAYHGPTGRLVWEDQHGLPDRDEGAYAAAAGGSRLFVAGFAATPARSNDFLLRAYDAITGRLLWEDRHDEAGGSDEALHLERRGSRVIAAGRVESSDGGFGSSDIKLKAYDARSGRVLWQDTHDEAGRVDLPTGLAAAGGKVFVVGVVQDGEGQQKFAIRTYDGRHGDLLWAERLERRSWANDVAAHGARVFAVGFVATEASPMNRLVRAYDARSGELLWEHVGPVGESGETIAVAAAGSRVFVASALDADPSDDLEVSAYRASSGALLWRTRLSGGRPFDIEASSGSVIAVGWRLPEPQVVSYTDLFVGAFSARDGSVRWADQHDAAGRHDFARRVALYSGRAFVAGDLDGGASSIDASIRAYGLR